MSDGYRETGGLRWGRSFWFGANATWPFAKLHATTEGLTITLGLFGFLQKTFAFAKSEITAIRKKHGLFSVGVIVEHQKQEYPPFFLFWTFHYSTLKRHLEQLGFQVAEG